MTPPYDLASTPRASGGIRRLFAPGEHRVVQYSIDFFETFPDTMAVDGVRAEAGFKKNGYLFIVRPPTATCSSATDTQLRLGCNARAEPEERSQAQVPVDERR